jgi:two-component system response regulator YesN
MKVLIVDDDHLVRKGIISLMPWNTFGLEVVGEAENGEKALRFLESNQVDLIITDLAMPTMSGIELIRILCSEFPKIWIVVLTFHQDFEHVQEALRLGAIDYIAKVELEKENMNEILRRITKRISDRISDNDFGLVPLSISSVNHIAANKVTIFIAIKTNKRPDFLQQFLTPEQYELVYEIHQNVWLLSEHYPIGIDQEDIINTMFENLQLEGLWAVAKVSGINEHNKKQLNKLIVNYLNREFFYEYRKDKTVYTINLEQFTAEEQILSESELYGIKKQWSSLEWVYNHELYLKLIAQMETIRPSLTKLESLFYSAVIQWERYTSDNLTPLFDPAHNKLWIDWILWIEEMRILIHSKFIQSQYSDEVMSGILRAVDYITQNISMDLKLTEVARVVHISRSYFSGCFRNIVGKTFNEYVRDARIEYAEVLLRQTNDPIYKVAEKCGYPDEKYFSKIFRKKVGKLPSEVRKTIHSVKLF